METKSSPDVQKVTTVQLFAAKAVVYDLFKDEQGRPLVATDGQAEIFAAIFFRVHPRVHVMTTTQYGKSLFIGLAVLARSCYYPEPWSIVSGNADKAHIIMDYVIQHIFDNHFTASKFMVEKGEDLESIRKYRNKSRLTFRVKKGENGEASQYSEIFLTTAKGAIGHGAKNVVCDESSLIPDKEFALIMRMLGGHIDNFICEVGNPFLRNHFMRASRSRLYYKIHLDYKRAIKEGRLTHSFVDEMREQPFFGILYEIKFPTADSMDDGGYMPLTSEDVIDRAKREKLDLFGDLRMGVDVAGGGSNNSTIGIRGRNGAKRLIKVSTTDTMSLIPLIDKYCKEHNIPIDDEHVYIDKVGIGKGLCDRMNEIYPFKGDYGTNDFGVNFGNPPTTVRNPDNQFMNLRAESYWLFAEDLNKGSYFLEDCDDWDELLDIKYKVQSDRKIKIKSKKEMLEDGIESPDTADCIALTYAKPPTVLMRRSKQSEFIPSSDFGL